MKRFGFVTKLSTVGLVALLFAATPVRSEEGNSDPAVRMMTNMVARNLARKYDLQLPSNLPKQKMDKEAMKEYRNHSLEMLLINPKAMAMRIKILGEKEPTPAQVQKMAESMSPIYQKAVDQIISENEKYIKSMEKSVAGTGRPVDDITLALYEKKIKEGSVNLEKLKKGTEETTKTLNRWKSGGFKPGEFSSIPVPFFPKPTGLYTQSSLSFWDQYVKMFIDAFQLDAGQQSMVYSVVNDLKTKAKAYRQDHKAEFAEIEKASKQLFKSNASNQEKEKKYTELQKKKEKLEKPVSDMFDDLKQRLMAIPTEKQRKAAQEALSK